MTYIMNLKLCLKLNDTNRAAPLLNVKKPILAWSCRGKSTMWLPSSCISLALISLWQRASICNCHCQFYRNGKFVYFRLCSNPFRVWLCHQRAEWHYRFGCTTPSAIFQLFLWAWAQLHTFQILEYIIFAHISSCTSIKSKQKLNTSFSMLILQRVSCGLIRMQC